MSIDTGRCFDPLFGEADGYGGDGYDADGYDRNGYDREGNPGKVDADNLDLAELWDDSPLVGTEFLDYLRNITRQPEEIRFVVFCVSCEQPAWQRDTYNARGDVAERLCENCAECWTRCDSCAKRYPDDEVSGTLNDYDVCSSCLSSNYTFCEECDGYYSDRDADEHIHDENEDESSGCCTSPQPEFTVRNDGCAPLANDTRATVTLPAGIVSREGLQEISDYLWYKLRDNASAPALALIDGLDQLGDQCQTREGNYPKRLSRHAYASYGIKLSPEILSHIGNIASAHSTRQSSYAIEVTRDLNMSAGDFYHDGSCWWGSYSESRCTLKSNGGFGLRTFSSYGQVAGRAWVLPLRVKHHELSGDTWTPTFDTVTPDAFMVFNGYGELDGYSAARIVAHMAGWTYRKNKFDCSHMYVNAGGYLVAPENIANGAANLNLFVSQHSNLFSTEKENADVRS
jgi:hypothetical protein